MPTEYRDLSPEGGARGNITDFDVFHNQRRNFLLDAERDNNVAPMFYLAPWTDKKMLESRWPELLVDDERYSIHFKRYVLHYDTDEMRTFWGGAFAASTQKDLRQITKELNISGFAFDVSPGGPRFYTNKKIDGMPGRAYDKRGVFYDTGIGIAAMQKFIHNLDVKPFWGGPFKAGVTSNFGISRYYAAFNADSAVIESGDVGEALNSIEKFINHKILVGNKSSISHESQNKYHMEIAKLDWQNMSPAEIRTIYRRIFAGNLLTYYKIGIIPGGDLCFGIEKLQKELPRLVELVLSGWQPVPAFKVTEGDDPELLLSRYGIGVNSFLAAGNASFKTKQVKCQVDNKYLGDYQWIFS